MRRIDYKEGRELEKTHVCAECGGGLVVVWGGNYGVSHHMIKCSNETETPHEGETKKRWAKEQPTYVKERK